jgi:hypothetical protein
VIRPIVYAKRSIEKGVTIFFYVKPNLNHALKLNQTNNPNKLKLFTKNPTTTIKMNEIHYCIKLVPTYLLTTLLHPIQNYLYFPDPA